MVPRFMIIKPQQQWICIHSLTQWIFPRLEIITVNLHHRNVVESSIDVTTMDFESQLWSKCTQKLVQRHILWLSLGVCLAKSPRVKQSKLCRTYLGNSAGWCCNCLLIHLTTTFLRLSTMPPTLEWNVKMIPKVTKYIIAGRWKQAPINTYSFTKHKRRLCQIVHRLLSIRRTSTYPITISKFTWVGLSYSKGPKHWRARIQQTKRYWDHKGSNTI
jgi:hypothetical protein